MHAINTQLETPRETFLEASGANLYFLDRVLQSIESMGKGRFLEIGCGTGIFSQSLAAASGMTAYGTEISQTAHAIASKRLHCSLVSGIELPFEDGFFSLVIAKDVLPMIKNKNKWFKEIYRVLDKDGLFISYFPNDKDFSEKPLYAFIQGSVSASIQSYGQPYQIIDAMVEAGFQKPCIDRLFLGTVRFDISYIDKHFSGFFNNTEAGKYQVSRVRGLVEGANGLAALSAAGIMAHYEWERSVVIGKKA